MPETYPRYHHPKPNQKCSVENCDRPAHYEALLYDYYDYYDHGEEFLEQDYTCPFLCNLHMNENEENAKGIRVPRGAVEYPFTNRHWAQGYTKYKPLHLEQALITDVSELLADGRIIRAFARVNDELIRYLAMHPETMRELEPRRFEELVAELFSRMGYLVELTNRTRDGGKDIYAIKTDGIINSLYLIECKRYSSSCKVGVEAVRQLYGVTEQETATMGIIATTSSFTKAALDFASPLRYRLSLNDYEKVHEWLRQYS